MATNYQVTISVSADTQQALSSGGFSLCALKAIAATAGGGEPLYWQVTKQFASSMAVQWTSQVAAYISTRTNDIDIITSVAIDYGQIVNLPDGSVTGGGLPDAMSMLNQASTQYTSGLAAGTEPVLSPIAAFPLYGFMMNAYAPIEKVLLMFTTYPAVAGAAAERSYAQGLLVDLTSATSREVSFDINSGWSWGGAAWGSIIPANTLLAPLLIELKAL